MIWDFNCTASDWNETSNRIGLPALLPLSGRGSHWVMVTVTCAAGRRPRRRAGGGPAAPKWLGVSARILRLSLPVSQTEPLPGRQVPTASDIQAGRRLRPARAGGRLPGHWGRNLNLIRLRPASKLASELSRRTSNGDLWSLSPGLPC